MHPSVNQSYTILFTDDIMDFNRSIIWKYSILKEQRNAKILYKTIIYDTWYLPRFLLSQINADK